MAEGLETRRLFGLEFVSGASVTDVVAYLIGSVGEHRESWRCVVTPNVDHLVRYARHPVEESVARDAWMVLPDGMPIVWTSRIVGRPLASRLAGSDVFDMLWTSVSELGTPTVVIAPDTEIAEALRLENPTARCIVAPMLSTSDVPAANVFVDEVVDVVRSADAQFLMICVSMEKHHLLARLLQQRCQATDEPFPIVMLLGASAAFHLGLVKRAPKWMQRSGLEWLHRLASDPRRMAKRYLVDDMRFFGLAFKEWRAARSASAEDRGVHS